MKPICLFAAVHPCPALILHYATGEELSSQIRKRFMPVRGVRQFKGTKELSLADLDILADTLISRHPHHLSSLDRSAILKCLRVIQRIFQEDNRESLNIPDIVANVEREFKTRSNGGKKKVTFKEGPHQVRHFDDDDELPPENLKNNVLRDSDDEQDNLIEEISFLSPELPSEEVSETKGTKEPERVQSKERQQQIKNDSEDEILGDDVDIESIEEEISDEDVVFEWVDDEGQEEDFVF